MIMTMIISNRRTIVIAVSLFSIAAAFPAWAGLFWEKEKLELTPEIGQKVVRTSYPFTNTGAASVSVVGIAPSCGCVATSLEKFDYAPGESGQIDVTFDAEMDKGIALAQRTIEVTTSDAPQSPKVLELKVHVREAVSVTPEGLVWLHGSKPEPKTVVVEASSGVEAIRLAPVGENDNFAVEVKPEVEGQRYRLTVTPRNIEAPSSATLAYNVESSSLKRRAICEIPLKVE